MGFLTKRRKAAPVVKGMPPTGKGSEHWHQSTFISIIRRLDHPAGKWTYATPNGFLRTKAMRIRAWQEGAVSGIWDVHVPYPAQNAPGLYLEFKVKGNTLTPEQKAFGEAMTALGYHMVVAFSWQEALQEFAKYLDLEITYDR